MSIVHTFAGNPLDRGEVVRRDEAWLAAAPHDPRSRVLLLYRSKVLVRAAADSLALAWLDSARHVAAAAALDAEARPVLLGLQDERAHFALDISALDDPAAHFDLGDARFEEPRGAAMTLPTPEAGILAQAKANLDWHRRHRFCGSCGATTVARRGGQVRTCTACNADNFPRTDPVAIMLIHDGARCLLGQPAGPAVRMKLFSALAGFIDQGESIEEAVRREVGEEAGIAVGAVRYHSSQPWPFPSSLMIGCLGEAASTTIRFDPHEMNDVRWFGRDEVAAALAGDNPELRLPGGIAIAHHLIKAWLDGPPGARD